MLSANGVAGVGFRGGGMCEGSAWYDEKGKGEEKGRGREKAGGCQGNGRDTAEKCLRIEGEGAGRLQRKGREMPAK